MPIDARLWSQNPIVSTYPACQAVKAAAEQGADAAYRYLRRLREGLMIERKKLDHAEALVGEAGPAGLDVERFRIDLASHAITEAFAADLDEVRDPPEEARAAGKVEADRAPRAGELSLGARSSATTARATASGAGSRTTPTGRPRSPPARRSPGRRPEPLEAVERFGRCATRELEELTRKAAAGARGRALGPRARLEAAAGRGLGRDALGGCPDGAQWWPLAGLAIALQRRSGAAHQLDHLGGAPWPGEPESNGRLRVVLDPELDRLGDLVAGDPGGQRQRHVDSGRHARPP